jgi:uracil-DNA glycosylase
MRLEALLKEVRHCDVCAEHLPLGPRPVVSAHRDARLLIIGQAPGRRVHESGVPWDDPSGKRLREWLGIDEERFHGSRIALMPMGFCYPGRGRSGDLPPRAECAELWHARLLERLPNVELTLLLSRHAQVHYLRDRARSSVTATVEAWREYLPEQLPMPHPSPRNNLWLARNPWFEQEVVPYLQRRVGSLLC